MVAAAVLVACPAAALAAERPDAGFSFTPDDPRAGQSVRFESSSCDPDGTLLRQAWDLDGDGAFDDAEGAVATTAFPTAGAVTVGLEVTAEGGETDVQHRTLTIDSIYGLPRPDSDRVMSPFPVVRLAGRLTDRGARVRILSVRGPVCSTVEIRCRGRSCPAKKATGVIGRKALRFRRFERRLRAGTVLTVRVSKVGQIGKYTRFEIRRDVAPKRTDRCLRPGEKRGTACPRD